MHYNQIMHMKKMYNHSPINIDKNIMQKITYI